MEQYNEAVLWLQQHLPPVLVLGLSLLGSLVVLGMTYVGLTPSKDDDAWLLAIQEKPVIGALLKLLQAFSPIAKKDGKIELSNKAPEVVLPADAPKA